MEQHDVSRAVSIPRSGLQAFRPEHAAKSRVTFLDVSIPRSGLQAFRRMIRSGICAAFMPFQSLVRAYKRSDGMGAGWGFCSSSVSIPRSGLQAFRLSYTFFPSSKRRRFNPSFGLTSVPTSYLMFALIFGLWGFNPSFGLTSVPTF